MRCMTYSDRQYCTRLWCLGTVGVVHAKLQVEEVHYLVFEGGAGPHVRPHVEHGGQKLLP